MSQPQRHPENEISFNTEITLTFRSEVREVLGEKATFQSATLGSDNVDFVVMQPKKRTMFPRSVVLVVEIVPMAIQVAVPPSLVPA